jgi:hypothetical protein
MDYGKLWPFSLWQRYDNGTLWIMKRLGGSIIHNGNENMISPTLAQRLLNIRSGKIGGSRGVVQRPRRGCAFVGLRIVMRRRDPQRRIIYLRLSSIGHKGKTLMEDVHDEGVNVQMHVVELCARLAVTMTATTAVSRSRDGILPELCPDCHRDAQKSNVDFKARSQ